MKILYALFFVATLPILGVILTVDSNTPAWVGGTAGLVAGLFAAVWCFSSADDENRSSQTPMPVFHPREPQRL